ERGVRAHERDLARRRGHRDRAGGVGHGQVDGAGRALGLLDEVVRAGRDRAAEGGDLPGRAARGGVLDGPAGEVDGGRAPVQELDEVVLELGPRVAAAAVDLADGDG